MSNERIAGEHLVTWDGGRDSGDEVASGVYFVRLSFQNKFISRKLVLLR